MYQLKKLPLRKAPVLLHTAKQQAAPIVFLARGAPVQDPKNHLTIKIGKLFEASAEGVLALRVFALSLIVLLILAVGAACYFWQSFPALTPASAGVNPDAETGATRPPLKS
ncbi:hypothetical protein NKH41_03290 [Mesorhizobium sp. M1169]|uniref:hypothetical protein n=1 Tax=unclassified Mesorhizobium TaxID=325217 RepID=UPI00333CA9B4